MYFYIFLSTTVVCPAVLIVPEERRNFFTLVVTTLQDMLLKITLPFIFLRHHQSAKHIQTGKATSKIIAFIPSARTVVVFLSTRCRIIYRAAATFISRVGQFIICAVASSKKSRNNGINKMALCKMYIIISAVMGTIITATCSLAEFLAIKPVFFRNLSLEIIFSFAVYNFAAFRFKMIEVSLMNTVTGIIEKIKFTLNPSADNEN
jgi:hypothetical protein